MKKYKYKKNKENISNKIDDNIPVPINKTIGSGYFVPNVNPLTNNVGVTFGKNQQYSSAPMEVPNGFSTQIPYNTATNSTIIQNPSAVPVTDYYKIVTNEPVSFACCTYLTTAIMSRIGDYVNKDKDVQKCIRDSLGLVGKNKLLTMMLTSLWAGFSAISYQWGYYKGNTTIIGINGLPPDSILLAVTPEGYLDPEFGVMQYYYNINSLWQQNPKAFSSEGNAPLASLGGYMTPQRSISFNPAFLSAIPEKERMLFTFNPIGISGNHYGVSLVQPSYSSVMNKFNQLTKISIASSYKASPLVTALTDTGTTVETQNGSISMAQNVKNVVEQGVMSGWMIFEGMHSVTFDTIDNTADLEKMIGTIGYYDSQIRNSWITPDLIGGSSSFANAKVSSDNNTDIINNFTLHFIDGLMEQYVKKIIKEAFDNDVEDFGYFELLENNIGNQSLRVKTAEGLFSMGILDRTDLTQVNTVLKQCGMPPVEKISDAVLFNQDVEMGLLGKNKKTNITKTNEEIGTPYAKGKDEVFDDKYGL